jgi:geranylgeranyl pyrophosphate synthase
LAVGHASNCDESPLQHLAAATELLHNASLVHDDLQDKDSHRRGRETVWRRFGPETAINLGDYFISSTYALLSRIQAPGGTVAQLVSLFADSTCRVIGGQSAEMETTRKLAIGPADYRRIARGKSGVLMALPVVGALKIAEAGHKTIEISRKAMEWLGLAYQIQDDLVDLFGLKDGRPAGVDLREGRISLPIIYYAQEATPRHRRAFEIFIQSSNTPPESEVRYWVDRLRHSSAVQHCREAYDRAIGRVSGYLGFLPPMLRETLEYGQAMLLAAAERQQRRFKPGNPL